MRMRTFERPSCCLTSVSICFSSAFLTFLIEFYLVHYFSRSGISSNNFSLRGFPPYANNFVFLHLGSKFFPYKVMQIRTLGPTVGNPSLWPTRQEFVSWRFLAPELYRLQINNLLDGAQRDAFWHRQLRSATVGLLHLLNVFVFAVNIPANKKTPKDLLSSSSIPVILSHLNEKACKNKVIQKVTAGGTVSLCIDSSNFTVIEDGLKCCQGKCIAIRFRWKRAKKISSIKPTLFANLVRLSSLWLSTNSVKYAPYYTYLWPTVTHPNRRIEIGKFCREKMWKEKAAMRLVTCCVISGLESIGY